MNKIKAIMENSKLKSSEVVTVGNSFLTPNEELKELSLPRSVKVGKDFLHCVEKKKKTMNKTELLYLYLRRLINPKKLTRDGKIISVSLIFSIIGCLLSQTQLVIIISVFTLLLVNNRYNVK